MNTKQMISTLVATVAAGAGMLVLTSGQAQAQAGLTFTGTTVGLGTFTNNTGGALTTAQTTALAPVLTFTGSTFSGMTGTGGVLPFATGGATDLGKFALAVPTGGFNFNPYAFDLVVNFTDPTGITGGPNPTFQADVKGKFSQDDAGNLKITFASPSPLYPYTSDLPSGHAGSFYLTFQDISVNVKDASAPTTLNLKGSIVAVPEPGTWAAFAFTGLGAAGLMLRARKSRGIMAA